MKDPGIIKNIRTKYLALYAELDERGRRRWAAVEARSLGWGGITIVAQATGISDRTIRNGLRELEQKVDLENVRQRSQGGGRPTIFEAQPQISNALQALIEPVTRGDPESPLKWTSKSTRSLSDALNEAGFQVSPSTVGRLLRNLGYSLQANRKSREGADHPDRNEQFEYISKRVSARHRRREPAISVDTKKKENLGLKKNAGKTYRPKGNPVVVDVHDFPDKKLGKAIPYGVYDIHRNEAGISIGITHDTAEFAVSAIKRWWQKLGRKKYKTARRILITADSGGSNSSRSRLWKFELQKLADHLGKIIEVCHYPPGTSKWNKIEHRVFCHITRNWQGVPLETLEIVVELISATSTATGLEVHAWIDESTYDTGKKVTEEMLSECVIKRREFHGDWNYEIHPRNFR